jgi:hypothetical protein
LEETVNYMDEDPFAGLGLRPVRLSDQVRFDECFALLGDPLSDYTFSQIFTWGNSLRILWKEVRGHLCVFANGTGDLSLLVPPIGGGDMGPALAEAFEVMDAYNREHRAEGRSRVEYVSEEMLGRMDQRGLVVEPMGADYVYDVRRMIDLGGGDLASKRQLRNRFMRNYEYRVEMYEAARHRSHCVELLGLWKGQQDSPGMDHSVGAIKRHKESLACEMTLEHGHLLGVTGLVVYTKPRLAAGNGGAVDWRLSGFTFGEKLGRDQSSILIEKTDLQVKGLAQFIFSEFCARCWSDRPLVNAGDDWGLESLAWTKMSYRPVRLMQKYALRMAERVAVAVGGGDGAMERRSDEGEEARHEGTEARRHEGREGSVVVAGEAVVVRQARKEDLVGALELERQCFSSYRLNKRQLQYLQQRPSALFLVAEQGGRIVGEGIALVRQYKHGLSGRIYSLAVDGSCRRQRIGQRLVGAMLEGLAERGVRRAYLEVEQSNTAAIKLYERHGFRSIGTLPDYYGEGRAGVHMMCMVPAKEGVMAELEAAAV